MVYSTIEKQLGNPVYLGLAECLNSSYCELYVSPPFVVIVIVVAALVSFFFFFFFVFI